MSLSPKSKSKLKKCKKSQSLKNRDFNPVTLNKCAVNI